VALERVECSCLAVWHPKALGRALAPPAGCVRDSGLGRQTHQDQSWVCIRAGGCEQLRRGVGVGLHQLGVGVSDPNPNPHERLGDLHEGGARGGGGVNSSCCVLRWWRRCGGGRDVLGPRDGPRRAACPCPCEAIVARLTHTATHTAASAPPAQCENPVPAQNFGRCWPEGGRVKSEWVGLDPNRTVRVQKLSRG
jgi:hypothetical protein